MMPRSYERPKTLAAALEMLTFNSPERKEAVATFREKRKRFAEGGY